ncbi:MAG: cob(I)yrinic acid a,c-diamide adenosyltransferase [Nitrososphaerota archaeon]
MSKKPFTATGDKGETSVATGRVAKDSLVVQALGDIDELDCFLGFARTKVQTQEVKELLKQIQLKLFTYAAVIHNMREYKITQVDVEWLEQKAIEFDKELPELRHFILPAGSEGSIALHIARAVCRRAERSVVALDRQRKLPEHSIPFINRLSSLLFVLARYINVKEGINEELVA